jgi:hypothetical protein
VHNNGSQHGHETTQVVALAINFRSHTCLTVVVGVPGDARACVGVHSIMTGTAVQTRTSGTVVDI